MALISSMVSQNISNTDINLMSSDGVIVPANRSVLALQSGLLSDLISSVPCCNTTAVSLPFNSMVVKNLLAIVSCGISLPLSRDDLLNVKVLADILDIKLGQLEVEKTDVKIPKKPRAKKKSKKEDALASSPKPYLQNDNDNDSDEIVEITPEIFHGGSEENGDTLPPHFLMQTEYLEDSSSAVSSPHSMVWNNEPELIELEADESGEKKYKCSFCPNKIFKKKPEIMRHFKKHIPLSQRKRFQCENCREKFISNSNLKTHMKVCTGVVKTYTCKRCKSEFDNKTDYEDHLAEVHNVGRNHECQICHKQLRRAGDVKKHMLTHSEGKPYVCDICGKRFRTESYVKVHKEAHYKNSPVKNPLEDDRKLIVDNENFNEEIDESAIEEMDENDTNDTDSLNNTTEVPDEEGRRFTIAQDNFIEDSPLAMARVI